MFVEDTGKEESVEEAGFIWSFLSEFFESVMESIIDFFISGGG